MAHLGLEQESRKELGNLLYQAHRSLKDSRLFNLYEHDVDEAAFGGTGFGVRQALVDGEAIRELLESTLPPSTKH